MHELALRWWEAGTRSQAGERNCRTMPPISSPAGGAPRRHPGRGPGEPDPGPLASSSRPLRAAGDSWQTWDCRSDQFEPDNLPRNGRVHCVLMHRLDPALLELLLVDERMTVWEPRDSEAEARALRRGDRHDHGYTCDPDVRLAPGGSVDLSRGTPTRSCAGWAAPPTLGPGGIPNRDRRLPTGAREQALTALRDLMVSQQGSDGRWEYQPLRAHPGGGRSYREIVAATLAAQGYVLTRDGAIGER